MAVGLTQSPSSEDLKHMIKNTEFDSKVEVRLAEVESDVACGLTCIVLFL